MLQRFSAAALVCLVTAAAPAPADVEMRWKFKPDERFYLEEVQKLNQTVEVLGNKQQQEMETTSVYSFTVKKADAAFLAWLHQPSNMVALNKETGAFPADNRFPVSDISNPLAKELYKLDTTGKSIWLENYIPPQIDSDADLPAGELVISGSGSPSAAAQIWVTQLREWRAQQLTQYQQYKAWSATLGG